jgi:isoleucyl-tRNA synthetase
MGKNFRAISKEIENLSSQKLFQLESGQSVEVGKETIQANEVNIYRTPQQGHEHVASSSNITVEIDASVDDGQRLEGLAREVVNRIQKLRKAADLKLDSRIQVEYQSQDHLQKAITENISYIKEQVLAEKIEYTSSPQGDHFENFEIEKEKITIAICNVN